VAQQVWSTHEVVQTVGCTYREVYYWVDRGYVRLASGRPETASSGTPLRFTLDDIIQLAAMFALVKAGVYPRTAAKVMQSGEFDDGVVRININFRAVADRVTAKLFPPSP
jgi:MerR-like DNA binding protein